MCLPNWAGDYELKSLGLPALFFVLESRFDIIRAYMIQPYHHTSRPHPKKFRKGENFKEFLNIYDLEIERVKEELGETKNQRVGVEIPEGMKKFTHELAKYLEQMLGIEVFISSDPCFGACDIKYYQFNVFGINKIIHFGNVKIPNRKLPMGMKVIFVPLFIKMIDLKSAISDAVSYLKENKIKKVGLASSIQYIKNIEIAEKELTKEGIKVFVGKGDRRVKFRGQVLGCNVSSAANIKNKVEKFIMFENGNFHAKPISIVTKKDIICFDPFTKKRFLFFYNEIIREIFSTKQRNNDPLKRVKKVAFLLSSKLGQSRIADVLRLKRMFESRNFSTVIVIADYVNFDSVNNIDVDLIVSTVCPRVALDEREQFKTPILSISEAEQFINNKVGNSSYVFDQTP